MLRDQSVTAMNAKLILAGLFALAAFVPQAAADTVPAPAGHAHALTAPGKVGQVLASLPYLNAHLPSTTARYYIYLCSASWCGPCIKALPHEIQAYPEMRQGDVVELLLVDFDHAEEDARKLIVHYGVPFPGTMHDNCEHLPGFTVPHGIPHAVIVSAGGEVVAEGHGLITLEWKKHITAYEKAKGLPLSYPEAAAM